jgi:hypothetical protein
MVFMLLIYWCRSIGLDERVAAQSIHIPRGERLRWLRDNQEPMRVLGLASATFDGLTANDVHAVRAVDAIAIERRVIE